MASTKDLPVVSVREALVSRLIQRIPFPTTKKELSPPLLRERRRYFNGLVTTGSAICLPSGVRENLFRRNFNGEMARFLYAGSKWHKRNKDEPFCSRDLAPKKATKASTDGTYCVHLGLIEKMDKRGRDTYYRLTVKGEEAVRGVLGVPAEFIVFRGILVAASSKRVFLYAVDNIPAKQVKFRLRDN